MFDKEHLRFTFYNQSILAVYLLTFYKEAYNPVTIGYIVKWATFLLFIFYNKLHFISLFLHVIMIHLSFVILR